MGLFDRLGIPNNQTKDVYLKYKEKLDLYRRDKDIDIDLVKKLLSPDASIRDNALVQSHFFAQKGDKRGLVALETAIKIKRNLDYIEFYIPKDYIEGVHGSAEEELLRLAREDKLLEDPKETQQLIALLFMYSEPLTTMDKIRGIGPNQYQDFQLLGTHLQCYSLLFQKV
ncbi:MAG TPA: hypothetical protein VE134_03040 [Methanomicrobiales archaeon]|nr:hypothetical protein [Methanomicrobiales archaeon]